MTLVMGLFLFLSILNVLQTTSLWGVVTYQFYINSTHSRTEDSKDLFFLDENWEKRCIEFLLSDCVKNKTFNISSFNKIG